MSYWLFKSEPETFSIDALRQKSTQTEHWEGVRNYQARNMLRDQVKKGDLVFFYHSNCIPPGIVGVVEVVKAGYPDYSAWDPTSHYFDPKSTAQKPQWFMVDIKFIEKFPRMITLDQLKRDPLLQRMQVCRRGNRLSITPVTKEEWQAIMRLARE